MFIKLGKFSLKLLYPIICLVLIIFESYAQNNWYTKRRGNVVVSYFINSTSKMLNIFIYIPIKICYYKSNLIENVEEGTIKRTSKLKKNLIVLVLFTVLELVYDILYIVYYVISRMESAERKSENKSGLIYYAHSYGIFFLENLQIIFIFLITKFILKYEYHLQSLICLVLFSIFSIIIDVINYENFIDALGGSGIFMLIFINLLLESMALVFQKYMMEKLFFSPILSMSIYGFVDFFFTIILGSITYAKNGWYCYGEETRICYLANFKEYFEDFGKNDIISLIASFAFKFSTYILIIYISYFLTPNHILLVYIVGKFIENAMEGEEHIVVNYILFVFLLITFIFYLEIFELDFCGINKNTKQSIENRAMCETLDNKIIYNKYSAKSDEDNEEDMQGSYTQENLSDPNSPNDNVIDGYKI